MRRLDPDLPLPSYAHPGDAGADLVAAAGRGDRRRASGRWCRTGVAIALPEGYVGLVHPRSGLAARLGVTVLNAPGTVDAGYRGEILVNLVNHDPDATGEDRARRPDRATCRAAGRAGHSSTSSTSCPTPRGVRADTGRPGGHTGCGRGRTEANGDVLAEAWRRAARPRRPASGRGRRRRRCDTRRRPSRPAAEHGPYDVAEAPAGVRAARPGQPADPGDRRASRSGCRPTRRARSQQVVLVQRRQRAAARRVRRARAREGIWDEVREEIRKSLFSDGVAAAGDRRRVRRGAARPGPYARGGLTDLRFVGIDGPRWMVRGALPGPGGHRPGRGRARSGVPARPRGRPRARRPSRSASRCRCGCPADAAEQALAERADRRRAASRRSPTAPHPRRRRPPRRRPSPRPRR